MTDDQAALLELDRSTFAAEANEPSDDWTGVLHRILADDFRLRRAIGEIENRERLITRLSGTEPKPREFIGEPVVSIVGDFGLVCSRVRFGDAAFSNA